MVARTFTRESTIVVDVCEKHGTWFDAGELRSAAPPPPSTRSTLPSAASTRTEGDADTNANGTRQAVATLDVALALEHARDEETARRTVDLADDLVDSFNFFVLGRARTARGRRYR